MPYMDWVSLTFNEKQNIAQMIHVTVGLPSDPGIDALHASEVSRHNGTVPVPHLPPAGCDWHPGINNLNPYQDGRGWGQLPQLR